MGFHISDGVAIGVAVVLLVCNLVAGCFYVAGYPVSYRMDQNSGDDDIRYGDIARYYYTIGVTITIFNLISLVVSAVPVSIVKRIGLALVIFWSCCSLFIMTQVQLYSIGTLVYPNCDDVPSGAAGGGFSYAAPFGSIGNYECRGDKLNFIATVFFMLTNSAGIAYGALLAAEEAVNNAKK